MAAESKMPDVVPKVLKHIKNDGLYLKDACAAAGVSYRQFRRWVKQGEEEIRRVEEAGPRARVGKKLLPFVELVDELRQAESERKKGLVTTIYESGTLPRVIKETTITQYVEKGQVISEIRVVKKRDQPPDWRAAIAMLERTEKGEWSRRTEITGADGEDLPAAQMSINAMLPGFNELPEELRKKVLDNLLIIAQAPAGNSTELEQIDRSEFFRQPMAMAEGGEYDDSDDSDDGDNSDDEEGDD